MQEEYLEMRGTELLIDGIAIAEVTNLQDAMAISDRVSNYVAELQRKIEKLEKLVSPTKSSKDIRVEFEEYDIDLCEQTGEPRSQCNCYDCCPDCYDELRQK